MWVLISIGRTHDGINAQLDEIDEIRQSGTQAGRAERWSDAMRNSVIDDISREVERRRIDRLKAMRDMFEKDRGRAPANIEELRDWMGAQHLDELKSG